MKFADIKVGDTVGVRSSNSNKLRHYRDDVSHVVEVEADRFRTQHGWFLKETGKSLSRDDTAVTLAEKAERNTAWHAAQRCTRHKAAIGRLLAQVGDSPEEAELLGKVASMLEVHLNQGATAPQPEAAAEPSSVEHPA